MRKMAIVLALGTVLLCAGCSGGNNTSSSVTDVVSGSGASESNAADGASVGDIRGCNV